MNKKGAGRPRKNQHLMRKYRLIEFPEDLDFADVDVCVWDKYGDHPEDRVRWDKIRFSEEGDISIPPSYEARVVKHFKRKGFSPDSICEHCSFEYRYHGWIPEESKIGNDLEGVDLSGHKVCPGDYILRKNRTYWPCKPNLFCNLYRELS